MMDSKKEQIVKTIMERLTKHDNENLLKCIKKVVTEIIDDYEDDEVDDEQVIQWILEMLMNI
jgi:hypothetical protein